VSVVEEVKTLVSISKTSAPSHLHFAR